MEANFLRFLLSELKVQVIGKRIEKVYQPAAGLWTFKLGPSAFLMLYAARKNNCLFFSDSRPENPLQPSPQVQWWRKRLTGRKIVNCIYNWPQRQVAWELSPGSGKWLLMDLVQGPGLQTELPADFGLLPDWPGLEQVLSQEEVYRWYPQLTPALRATLKTMDRPKALCLLEDLAAGQAHGFYLYQQQGKPYALLPWRLTPGQTQGLHCTKYESALQAAQEFGWSLLQKSIGTGATELSLGQRRRKRLRKTIRRLDKEEERLQEIVNLKQKAYILQNNLGLIDRHQKVSRLEVRDSQGQALDLELDPALSVLSNMQLWFKKGTKAQKGLQNIARRKKEVLEELQNLDQAQPRSTNQAQDSTEPAAQSWIRKTQADRPLPARARGLQVHVYQSSHGFFMLRGKNQKANHKLLSQAAKPFDFWFHVQEGPGAHVILLRDSPLQQVPWGSMQEAAVLAGLASVHSASNKAEVSCAQVKSVRKVKGGALGQVQVQKMEQTFLVDLDQELESRLRIS